MHRGWLLMFCITSFILFALAVVSEGMNIAQRNRWNDSLQEHQCFITDYGMVLSYPRATLFSAGKETTYLVEYPVTVAVAVDGELVTYTRTLRKEGNVLLKPEQHVDCFVVEGSQVQVEGQKMPTGWLVFSCIASAVGMVTSLIFSVQELRSMVERSEAGREDDDISCSVGEGSEEEEEDSEEEEKEEEEIFYSVGEGSEEVTIMRGPTPGTGKEGKRILRDR